eukprot:SAG31_NODE_4478_length_3200_cov_7.008062_1_plen_108_part_00
MAESQETDQAFEPPVPCDPAAKAERADQDDEGAVVAAGGSLRALLHRLVGKKAAAKLSASTVGYIRDPTASDLRAAQRARHAIIGANEVRCPECIAKPGRRLPHDFR